jgi:hypothetical protein
MKSWDVFLPNDTTGSSGDTLFISSPPALRADENEPAVPPPE